MAIEASGLGRDIDDRAILDGVNLRVPEGAFISILGPNGAGKTTLLHILATLTRPTRGDLRLLGQPVSRATVRGLRCRIGMIGHQPMLYRHLSARENLHMFGRLYGLTNVGNRADALLEKVGLLDRGDDAVATFSRGMVQRIAIARALMHEPALLLADEPFAGLDVASMRALEGLLQSLHAAGKTIFMSSHDPAQSLRLAQRVLVLRCGTLIANCPTEEVDPDLLVRALE